MKHISGEAHLASVHDRLPKQARPVGQVHSEGLVAGVEGAVQPSCSGAAHSEGHQAGLTAPVWLVGLRAVPRHAPAVIEAAPPQLRPLPPAD